MPRAKSKLSINKQSDENELEFFSHEPDRLDEMVEGNPISEITPRSVGVVRDRGQLLYKRCMNQIHQDTPHSLLLNASLKNRG